ncbi:MAG: hypothetical protein HN348_05930 [Proteobacteria bacterium]|nr:hypothetical protein [Pseudomonadota bacterium]
MVQQFFQPTSIDEARGLKSKFGEQAAFIGGGTLVGPLAPNPTVLIDIGGLAINKMEESEEGIRFGAGCTIQQLCDWPQFFVPLREAAKNMVNRNIRNLATIGGQIGARESCGDLLPALVAMQATIVVVGDKTSEISVGDYINGSEQGLITEVRVPFLVERFAEVGHYCFTSTDRSLITVAVSLATDGDAIKEPIVAIGGVAERVIRLTAVEEALHGEPPPEREFLEKLVTGQVSPGTDFAASAAYRAHMAGVIVATVLGNAWQEAK